MLKPLDGFAVENPANPGTPDVNFIDGWIELKIVDRWPPQGGIVRIPHYTPQQRVCILKRWLHGGRVLLLLRVKREWLLFDGKTAAEYVGRENKIGLLSLARHHWTQKPSGAEFRKCVLGIRPNR